VNKHREFGLGREVWDFGVSLIEGRGWTYFKVSFLERRGNGGEERSET
jgi:hypothetical protein